MNDLVTIRLLRYPLPLYVRSKAHFDELLRELQLMDLAAHGGVAHRDLPQRLSELVTTMTARYQARVDHIDELRNAALARGETLTDLVYEAPVEVRGAVVEIAALLDECDEFCRSGEHLLTLATPPDIAEFRRWNIDQVVRQIDGEDPVPWHGGI